MFQKQTSFIERKKDRSIIFTFLIKTGNRLERIVHSSKRKEKVEYNICFRSKKHSTKDWYSSFKYQIEHRFGLFQKRLNVNRRIIFSN